MRENVSRLLRAETLAVEFRKPWNSLAETVIASRNLPDNSARNQLWCDLLDRARTYFEENPS
jgi:hypothetical protein